MSTPTVIAIAGRIDSGKSSVAAILAAKIEVPVLSFGAYVRSTFPPNASREQLQEGGSQLLERLGPDGLITAVLNASGLGTGDSAIWEGLRHRSVLDSLRALYAPIQVQLFFLSPPEGDRLARAQHEAGGAKRLRRWESHETESVAALVTEADLNVSAPTPDAAAAEILAHLG